MDSRTRFWSTPDLSLEPGSGVLQLSAQNQVLEYSSFWFRTRFWSTPDSGPEPGSGVLQILVQIQVLEYLSFFMFVSFNS